MNIFQKWTYVLKNGHMIKKTGLMFLKKMNLCFKKKWTYVLKKTGLMFKKKLDLCLKKN